MGKKNDSLVLNIYPFSQLMAAFKEFISLCITETQLNSDINKWLEFGLLHKFLVMPLLRFLFSGEQA